MAEEKPYLTEKQKLVDYTEPNTTTVVEQKIPVQIIQQPKKLLVLDLDETLVHTSFQPVQNADFSVDILIEDAQTVQKFTGYVYKRPYVDEFLAKMKQQFEVIVFTASIQQYCDLVMDILDPDKVIKKLYRTDCTFQNGAYVKDLRRFETDLSQVILMDNSALSCMMQPQNSIICPAFYDDKSDTYLQDIENLMEVLSQCTDIRKVLLGVRDTK
ncbi:Nuclear_LIM interactor-interacting factor [Hexamita inflata]|uniref:Nuclear LIM interactor-interacting factor n=1 Tax=Hexamita inflata TaxID=28002 RepID=A0AA86R9I0_9EUKA|nr:Nuclear LIM interactor-interacting factor [Hexamita inflata]